MSLRLGWEFIGRIQASDDGSQIGYTGRTEDERSGVSRLDELGLIRETRNDELCSSQDLVGSSTLGTKQHGMTCSGYRAPL